MSNSDLRPIGEDAMKYGIVRMFAIFCVGVAFNAAGCKDDEPGPSQIVLSDETAGLLRDVDVAISELDTMIEAAVANPIIREELDSLYAVETLIPDSTEAGTTGEQVAVLNEKGMEFVKTFLKLPLPLGWNKDGLPDSFYGWLLRVVGLLATTLAVSLGAPFWYDILRKLLDLRKTLRKKIESSSG